MYGSIEPPKPYNGGESKPTSKDDSNKNSGCPAYSTGDFGYSGR